MEFIALGIFLLQVAAWFVLPAGKNKPETKEKLSSIGDEPHSVAA